MSGTFDLEIITPTAVLFAGKVVSVSCPGASGRFQVLHNHAPFISSLEIGEMHVDKVEGQREVYFVGGGVLHVLKNKVMLLADSAEHSNDIDVARAEESRSRAEIRIKSNNPSIDLDRAKLALLRALNRIKIASGS